MNRLILEDETPASVENAVELKTGVVTGLLEDWKQGDATARDRLVELVYRQLLRMAHGRLGRERRNQTMDTGTLANEVYLRLFSLETLKCSDREGFFRLVGKLMRQILVDAARARKARKRGGDQYRLELAEELAIAPPLDVDLLALDEALTALAHHAPELVAVIEVRFFAGRTLEETAELLNLKFDTVKRQQRRALTYLYRDLKPMGGSDGASTLATD